MLPSMMIIATGHAYLAAVLICSGPHLHLRMHLSFECCDAAGPVNIHEQVMRAMDRPSQNHRDPWFPPFFQQILEDTKYIFKTTEGTPFVFPGTGTGGWEVALTNTLSPGDKVVTFRYGQFSHLWVDMMQRLGLDVRTTLHLPCPTCQFFHCSYHACVPQDPTVAHLDSVARSISIMSP
jgi:hypothetical protein